MKTTLLEPPAARQGPGPIAQPLWRSVYAAYDKRVKGFEIHPTLYIFGETMGIESA